MTYYRIFKYLKSKGLTTQEAHYVRNMIRELVMQRAKRADKKLVRSGHQYSHNGPCKEPQCYFEVYE